MRILLLQLKRIGDLVLTSPAIAALRTALPDARIALAVDTGTADLLPAIEGIDEAIVFGKRRGWTPWQQVLTGRWDACLDFTGTDRSALASRLSRAPVRATFEWVRRKRLRALAYTHFINSAVRERHTSDHYGDLLGALNVSTAVEGPRLRIPPSARADADELREPLDLAGFRYALLHPGSARVEKYWLPERWAEVAAHLRSRGIGIVFTGKLEGYEGDHVEEIYAHLRRIPLLPMRYFPELPTLAALIADAILVISTDTAVVHLAAAFQRPQIALFGPTNPFHWRPRHEHAVVLSGAQSDAPLTQFDPRMKGAPMERISVAVVCRAIDTLLANDRVNPSR